MRWSMAEPSRTTLIPFAWRFDAFAKAAQLTGRGLKANNEAHPLVSDWSFKGVGIVQDLDSTIDYYAVLVFEKRLTRTSMPHL